MTTSINVFLIHHPGLNLRLPSTNKSLQVLDEVLGSVGIKVNIETIDKFNPADINVADFEKQVKYEKKGNENIDKLIAPLGIEELSNILKHKEAWLRTMNTISPFSIVIEDDTVIMDDGKQIIHKLFKQLKATVDSAGKLDWDILMMGISKPNPSSDFIQDVRDNFTILPSKECYIVTPESAKKLVESLSPITFNVRHHLSWCSMDVKSAGLGFKVVHTVQRCTIDGSKLGLFPSSIHPNNLLILNFEYMEMWKAFSNPGKLDYATMKALYDNVKHIGSPDTMHLFAVILFRCDRFDEARDMFEEAIVEMQKKRGLLNARSDLLNNCIRFNQNVQTDLTTIRKVPSRYVDAPLY